MNEKKRSFNDSFSQVLRQSHQERTMNVLTAQRRLAKPPIQQAFGVEAAL
jgi:DNA-binding GntR family transcriptional regulator